ncbi:SDR family oxidoreductase [Roseovarius sp. LXJ103]|uniref:SDR family oxidoreductase n=1 Tax=Roseovarius carneus TaxID=2853164 RepID=UPI000D60EF1A|nr:SDR family oxidoreductase [Roseovarius carneus]MBZ8118752.1 SDR family oxidoreductase [Roseovarius carneus]PWE35574.1 short-chain dehydrogenase [Pelagicola sp. LXJ1103]
MHVVITGANRGIGATLAADYTARGDTVTGTTRAPGATQLDVTDPAQIAAFAANLKAPVDLLICNAGVYLDREDTLGAGYQPHKWAETFAVNVAGVFLTIEALLPHLRAAQTPKIAIISSTMASQERAPGGSYIYRSSKAAALNLGRNLSVDLKPDGIAIGIYHPGWVRTDMGTDDAEISVEESAAGLTACFDRLSLESTGSFLNYDGSTHVW